jgi:hypothetical protein
MTIKFPIYKFLFWIPFIRTPGIYFFNELIAFHETWYEYHVTRAHPTSLQFSAVISMT